jgi:hypothetical protein
MEKYYILRLPTLWKVYYGPVHTQQNKTIYVL